MRLLVSVRSAAETRAALEGGADVIDAKEPDRGPLGAVDPVTAAEILAVLPETIPFSAALGDPGSPAEAAAAVSALPARPRPAAVFVKLGFAGGGSPDHAGRLLQAAVDAAARHPARPGVIAAAYADAELAGTPDPLAVVQLAGRLGAAGVLMDTWGKDSGRLLDWCAAPRLAEWVRAARQAGLLCALAGGLRASDLEAIAAVGCDLVGFRGAACDGGRGGRVGSSRVRQLRSAVHAAGPVDVMQAIT